MDKKNKPIFPRTQLADRFPTLVIIVLAIVFGVCQLWVPLVGDDLGYAWSFKEYDSLYGAVRSLARHWWLVNGRLADKILPALLGGGALWLRGVVGGVAFGAFFLLMDRLCFRDDRRHRVAARMILIGLLAFTFPWWDSTMLMCVVSNYLLSVDLGLLFMIVLFGSERSRRIGLVGAGLLSVAAGMMHEAMGLPLLAGIVVWVAIDRSWRRLTFKQRTMIICFAVGVAFCVLSPGWLGRLFRAVSDKVPDDPMALLLLKSCPWVLALLVMMILWLVRTPRRLKAEMLTPRIIWVVASVVSMCAVGVGGIVGRSGWFACSYALIAIYQWFNPRAPRIPRRLAVAVSALLTAVLLVHYGAVLRWQSRMGEEMTRVEQLYRQSPSGTIFCDVTSDRDLPQWLVLHKTRSVPDADDFYLIETMTRCLGDSLRPFALLPAEASKVKVENGRLKYRGALLQSLRLKGTDSWLSTAPADADERGFFTREGRLYVSRPCVIDGMTIQFSTPADIDPGDR